MTAPVLCVIDGKRQPDTGWLCRQHRDRLDYLTDEIALLIVDTQHIRDGGAPRENGPSGGHRKKRADPPAPGDVTIMALYDARTLAVRTTADQSEPIPAVLSMVASWVQMLAEERPLTAELPKSVLAQLALLRRHGDWFAGHGAVEDYLRELEEIHKALRGVVHDHTVKRIGWCDLPAEDGEACGGPLMVENGSHVVKCSRCRATWTTPQEQARLAVRLA